MTTRLQQRFLVAFIGCFVAATCTIGAFMVYASRNAELTPLGHLFLLSVVGSAATFSLSMLSFVRRGYDADLTSGVNFFSFAFGPAPTDSGEKAAWVAARRVVASWLGIAASMALLVTVETLAGHWHLS